jgi:isocitrate dehydrogenase
VLKESKLALKAGEIIDATVMRKKALVAFLEQQIAKAKADGVLFSLHMKATMMKVSTRSSSATREGLLQRPHRQARRHARRTRRDFNNGFGDLIAKLDKLPADKRPRSRPTSRPPSPAARAWRW